MSDKKFTYDFTESEIKAMALFFRDYSTKIPKGIKTFANFIENYIYNSMTIDEAENFFCG